MIFAFFLTFLQGKNSKVTKKNAVVRITLTEPPTGKRKQYDKEGVEMKYGRME